MGRDTIDKSHLRCLVVDDNTAIREATAAALHAEGVTVVGMAADSAGALAMLGEHAPDAIVIDLRLGGSSGIELARSVATLAPSTAVVLHTTYADSSTVTEALAAGVRAVVLKRASTSVLLRALAEASAGRIFIDPKLRGSTGS